MPDSSESKRDAPASPLDLDLIRDRITMALSEVGLPSDCDVRFNPSDPMSPIVWTRGLTEQQKWMALETVRHGIKAPRCWECHYTDDGRLCFATRPFVGACGAGSEAVYAGAHGATADGSGRP